MSDLAHHFGIDLAAHTVRHTATLAVLVVRGVRGHTVLVQHRKGIPPERLGFLSHRESLLNRRESLPLWWESYLLPQLARAA